jgi:hypothetical protein
MSTEFCRRREARAPARSRSSAEGLSSDKEQRRANVKKIIPFRTTGKKRVRRPRTTRDQILPASRRGDEEDMVTVLLKDGTWETISGKNLEMDIEYRDGVPYLVVRERR